MNDPRFDELVRLTEGEVTTRRAEELQKELATSAELRATQASVDELIDALTRPAPALEQVDLRGGLWERPAPAPRRTTFRWLAMAGTLGLIASAALVAVRPHDDIRAKGGEGALTGFEAFVLLDDGVSPLGATMRPTDALAFAYRNLPGSKARALMVYAVDTRGHTFWFYPAWVDPQRPPSAMPIGESNGTIRLGEAIRHELSPGPLVVHALFLERPVSVLDVEAGRLPPHEAQTLSVEVTP